VLARFARRELRQKKAVAAHGQRAPREQGGAGQRKHGGHGGQARRRRGQRRLAGDVDQRCNEPGQQSRGGDAQSAGQHAPIGAL
jgi:hypothetical protein